MQISPVANVASNSNFLPASNKSTSYKRVKRGIYKRIPFFLSYKKRLQNFETLKFVLAIWQVKSVIRKAM